MTKQLTRKERYKTIAIINLGAVLEWFEFCLYGYLATYLTVLFFPKYDSSAVNPITNQVHTLTHSHI